MKLSILNDEPQNNLNTVLTKEVSAAEANNKFLTVDLNTASITLEVSEYNAQEKAALQRLPNRLLVAFQVFLFSKLGYPLSVDQITEIQKYLDVMHERRGEDDFINLLGNITGRELEDLKKLNLGINEFFKTNFKRNAVAANAPLRALNVLRHLRFLVADQKLRVFEAGSGSGYLGGLLIQNGHYYAATDVTQGFYLYQNHYWNHLTKGSLRDFASTREDIKTWRTATDTSLAAHLPWWKFAELRPGNIPEFDIFTCNHAFCEMHEDCILYTVRTIKEMLRGNGFKAVVFEGWGWDKENSIDFVTKTFYQNGFVLIHNDKDITVFVPANSEYAANALQLPVQTSRENLRVENNSLVVDRIPITSFMPCYWGSEANPVSRAITEGRKRIASEKTVTLDQVKAFYTSIVGPNHKTEDEEFWDYIGKLYQ